MNEQDVLARAARALRSANPGEHQGSGFTRARIMTSLHQSRRGRLYRWLIGAPLISVLLVGSAWAQSAGKWPVVWAAVTSVFSAAAKPSESTRAERRTDETRAKTVAPSAPVPAVSEPEQPPVAEAAPPPPAADDAPALAPDPAPRAAPLRDSALAARARQRRASPSPASTPAAEASPEPREPEPQAAAAEPKVASERSMDPELARFRAAHELHFQGGHPSAAVAAYSAYLREFPRGRFVPEARYNMALDYIKLGEKDKARRALRPFADGAYGGYRKHEAEELLEALR
jgi:TolA-binding protein